MYATVDLSDSNLASVIALYLHQHEGEDLEDHVKIWSRVGFVLPSLDEERPAGVDRQGEEGEEHAEQLDIGHPSSGLHNVYLE